MTGRISMRDVTAVVVLIAVGVLVTGIILANQRAAFPSWVPVVGQDRFQLEAEFSSAQAVTPGQGQTVDIAGVSVGEVSGVRLEDGRAVVEMSIESEYGELIHEDASLLLRPKTGLMDMVLQLDPGTEGGAKVEEGETIPLASTEPNVNPDEILASLDADTRSFLNLLLTGGGKGLGGRGRELSAGLRRLEPTARDIARITSRLAERRRSIRRAIHNFSLFSEELGDHDTELAGFVASSNAVLGSFAEQEAAIRASLRDLPAALNQTRGALAGTERLSVALAPALRDFTPGAHALGPALRGMRPLLQRTVRPIRDQIRPFTRQARTPIIHTRQASVKLGQTTLGLRTAFQDLNRALNALAYNPPGGTESNLFYLGWLNHLANTTFMIQDGQGAFQRGMVLISCSTNRLALSIAAARPFLFTLMQVTNVPTLSATC